jgi:hypothetical protein
MVVLGINEAFGAETYFILNELSRQGEGLIDLYSIGNRERKRTEPNRTDPNPNPHFEK